MTRPQDVAVPPATKAAARIREALEAGPTPGKWAWSEAPGAGIEIRGPYKDSTRLLFSDIWRQFPEPAWDREMRANADWVAACSPDSLRALLAERDELAKDAARWRLVAGHWKDASMRWKKEPNVPKSITITVDFGVVAAEADQIEGFLDAALTQPPSEADRTRASGDDLADLGINGSRCGTHGTSGS